MPKILHRIFFNFNDGIDPFLSYLETWKKELPDFEIKMWDKTNLPLDLNEYTRNLAAAKNHAFLSDFFRCWLLATYGGVYLDADIEILDGNIFRKIYDDTQASMDHSLFIGIESKGNGFLTAHSMGVKDGTIHPVLSFLMGLYEKEFTGPLRHCIKSFNIPFLMSLYFREREAQGLACKSEHGAFTGEREVFIVDGIKIYPADVFSPVTERNGMKVISSFSENTCLCHHFAATWKTIGETKQAVLFEQGIDSRDYQVHPSAVQSLVKRYGKKALRLKKLMWHFQDKQILQIEKFLNFMIPYGGLLHRIAKNLVK